jgi:hypothetical protein
MGAMNQSPDRPETLVIVAPDLASFYEYVKPRQEAGGQSIVVLLDRRRGERRTDVREIAPDRRVADRRAQPAETARALMSVLGFTILHRDGDRYTA